jgi:isocitrate lyase
MRDHRPYGSQDGYQRAQFGCESLHGRLRGFELPYVVEPHPRASQPHNCSPSFNWKRHLDDATIATFQKELGAMGYRFQFITLAGFHSINASMFQLATGYAQRGMAAYVELQEEEFAMEDSGYTATRHQREVGAGYFDQVSQVISGGTASTLALQGSREQGQFYDAE